MQLTENQFVLRVLTAEMRVTENLDILLSLSKLERRTFNLESIRVEPPESYQDPEPCASTSGANSERGYITS